MIRSKNDPFADVEAVKLALVPAMKDAIRRARQFNTTLVIWRDERMVHLSADEAESELESNQQPTTEN